MIAPKIIAEVRRLLAEGLLSQRRIAKAAGVSRGTVGAIASGKRPDYQMSQQPWDDLWEEPTGPPERCPSCGGMVYMPCRLCRVRQAVAEDPRLKQAQPARRADGLLQLNLRPEHQARYEEVRRWRQENAYHLLSGLVTR